MVVNVEDGGEIGLLQSGFNQMVHGLRERAQLRDLFGRHVGVEVAQRALAEGSGLGGEQHSVSALFVDLVGSTALAEVLPPGEVVATLNAFFDTVVRVVSEEGGWVNKFEGDGALCVFGAPGVPARPRRPGPAGGPQLDAPIREMARDHHGVSAGIGVSSGVVVAGNVGTEQRYEYTVIGRAVNEAARLTEIAKGRPARVLASGSAVAQAGPEAAKWASLGTVALRGSLEPVAIYEPFPAGLPRRPAWEPSPTYRDGFFDPVVLCPVVSLGPVIRGPVELNGIGSWRRWLSRPRSQCQRRSISAMTSRCQLGQDIEGGHVLVHLGGPCWRR